MISLIKAENARLLQENASLAKYKLGFSRRFRVTGGPNNNNDATPVYMEGTLAVNDEYYEDCCEGRVDGEMDRWYPAVVRKKQHSDVSQHQDGGTPLVELPKLEYHIEGMHTVFRVADELEDATFVVSLTENGSSSIEMEHHIVWFYNEPIIMPPSYSQLTFDEMIQKFPDRWKIDTTRTTYRGGHQKYQKSAKLTLKVHEAADILRQLFGPEAKLMHCSPQFDMNEAGGDRFTYSPNGVKFDEQDDGDVVNEKDDKELLTPEDELKELNTRLKQENATLWSYKRKCCRHVKITGPKDTPVYCTGEANGDGAWFVEYGGTLKPNPRSKGVLLQDVASLKVHVEGTNKTEVLRINELSGVQCIITLDEDGKCSLSLNSDDFFLDSDVSTTTKTFGPLNGLSSEWQHKTEGWPRNKRVAKREFRLFEMKTILRDVFQGDTKVRAKFNRISFQIRLFEDDYW